MSEFKLSDFLGKVLCGSGHRPRKLGGYGDPWMDMVVLLACRALETFKPIEVITGMALGWDMALAHAANKLGIPYIAAVPFEGQEARWAAPFKRDYKALLMSAQEVVYVCDPGYKAYKMQKRNEWMVNQADYVLALWDGSPGGTANCLRYARDTAKKPIINCWTKWTHMVKEHNFCKDAEMFVGGQVVHCKKEQFDVYIGRGKGGEIPRTPGSYGYFGNPFVKGEQCSMCGEVHKTGGSTLTCYRAYLEDRLAEPVFFKEFLKLEGKTLGCWCKPGPCHGDVILEELGKIIQRRRERKEDN